MSKKYSSVLGRTEPLTTYPQPDPNGGWVLLLNNGLVFESSTGLEEDWTGPVMQGFSSIPSFVANSGHQLPYPGAYLHKIGGFWFTRKPEGGDGNSLAWANGIDTAGAPCFPSVHGWVSEADPGGGTYGVASIYPVEIEGCAFMVLTRAPANDSGWRNTLWKANVAVDATSTVSWTQLNLSGSDTVYKSITDGLALQRIDYAATDGANKHVFVAKFREDDNQYGARHILYFDSTGSDWSDITLIQATVPGEPERFTTPVYSAFSSSWFVGTDRGILKSTDGAANWTAITLNYDSGSVCVYDVGVSSTGTVLAVGKYHDAAENAWMGIVLKSTDDGESWTAVANNDETILNVGSAAEGIWMVGGNNGVVGLSTTDGETFGNIDHVEDTLDAGGSWFTWNPHCVGLWYGGLL